MKMTAIGFYHPVYRHELLTGQISAGSLVSRDEQRQAWNGKLRYSVVPSSARRGGGRAEISVKTSYELSLNGTYRVDLKIPDGELSFLFAAMTKNLSLEQIFEKIEASRAKLGLTSLKSESSDG